MRTYLGALGLAIAVIAMTLFGGGAYGLTRDYLSLRRALSGHLPTCGTATLTIGPTGYRLSDGRFVPLIAVRATDDPRVFTVKFKRSPAECFKVQ